ncbi:MAG TPA: hypothetical protein VF285_13060 [Castellaniella sp.]|uniref:hypothetical protein n=1 Tax=Castellaniella sp. TaxID=1955812 RepID=UPI002EDD3B2C
MEAQARCVRASGRAAFFIRIEDIEEGFETAFELGGVDAFEDWLGSQEEAWFFLDSVDEARLENPRAFEKAIRRFAARVGPASGRAHIFISSRPYAWRVRSDRDLLERYLPLPAPRIGEISPLRKATAAGRALRVYLLDPLDEADIRIFAEHRNTPQVEVLLAALQRANLISMAARPFDLEGILAKWSTDLTLDGRLGLLQHNVELHLKEIDPDRGQRRPLSWERARQGARLLAAAVVLMGEPGVRVPDSDQGGRGIEAETVLVGWEPPEIQTLLERGIFNGVLYGMVRFRHREVRELLAAEWFGEQLRGGGSRHSVESLFIRKQYGRSIITPRLRPVLPWLILFDDEIRHKVLKIAPGILLEGGDVARLPVDERRALLAGVVRSVAEDSDDRSARDNSAIARIAQSDLAGDVLHLIAKYRHNDEAIFFLGRLVWQGAMAECVPALSEIAGDPEAGLYARIASTRAVMTCGSRAQGDQLWAGLLASPKVLPRKLFAEVLADATPSLESVHLLLASIGKLSAYERYVSTGLEQAFLGFVDRLPVGSALPAAEPLRVLIKGLNGYLGREPYIEQQECHVSRAFGWLLAPALHAVERLVIARSETALSPEALCVMLEAPAVQLWGGGDYRGHKNDLHEIVPAWRALNDALFWHSVEECRVRLDERKSKRLVDDWPVQWLKPYWRFGVDRFEDVLGFVRSRGFLDDRMVALSLAYRLFMQADRPAGWLDRLADSVKGNPDLEQHLDVREHPPQSALEFDEQATRMKDDWARQQEERRQNRVQWVARLKAAPEVVQHPPGLKPGEISGDQCWLLTEMEQPEGGTHREIGANWMALIPEFGEEVARAYRDAAVSSWRHYSPGLRSQGQDTNSIPYALIFAMAGLEIEAGEDGFFESLTQDEARHALRYLVWEMNGLPDWLEQLYQLYPKLVLEAVLAELYWELEHTGADAPAHYLVGKLVHAAPWLHRGLAPEVAAWLALREVQNAELLSQCVQIVLSGDADRKVVSKLAQSKAEKNGVEAQRAIWYALWVDTDADEALPAVEKWLSSLPAEKASGEAQLLITKLMGTRRSFNDWPLFGSFRNPRHLKALYMLMHQYIRTKDDIDHSGKGVFSPVLRDDAQDGREALVKQLSEISGKEAYVALAGLASEHPDPAYRPWMERLAFQRAQQDADMEPWSVQQVRDYAQKHQRTPETQRQLFDLAVDRLIDLKAWLERGSDSPYKTWQRVDEETEMRNLVAGRLAAQSAGRYTCAQENEFPNRQRPDILIQNARVTSAVPIELKLLDNGWSGPALCERLRNQLAGDYLREQAAGCGVMLLVWQGRSRQLHWRIGRRRVKLRDLENALESYWETVADGFPHVAAIKVVLIDLTARGVRSEG